MSEAFGHVVVSSTSEGFNATGDHGFYYRRDGEGVIDRLVGFDYPGNVRELENMVEQAVALSGGGAITVDDILPQAPRRPSKGPGRTLADIVDAAEREAVEDYYQGKRHLLVSLIETFVITKPFKELN